MNSLYQNLYSLDQRILRCWITTFPLGVFCMALNLQLFLTKNTSKKGLVEVRFCWAAGILYGVEIIHSRPLRVTEPLSRCFYVNLSDCYTVSALPYSGSFFITEIRRTHTLCRYHSLMFTVRFNKVRQINCIKFVVF